MNPFETPDRLALRDLVRRFTEHEIVPHLAEWERAGEVPRSLHAKAASLGLLGIAFPEAVGGGGGTILDSLVVTEELILAGGSSGLIAALFTHGIACPHIVESGDAALIDAYVRPTLAGEKIGSLAITEPDGGSDVAGIRTTAKRADDGGQDAGYVVNGSKTYITSGARADFVVTAARTGGPGHEGISLVVVDTTSPGFRVTRRLEKLGWHCSDTAELSYDNVPGRLVGPAESGFRQIMRHFVDLTLAWVKHRHTFGRPLSSRQVVRHRLAEMARRVDVARTYVRAAAVRVANGEPVVTEVAMAKNTAVDACDFVVDAAVQLHGGFGYLRDAEVERHYRDARIMGIGGGTTEIMNEIIAKQLGV